MTQAWVVWVRDPIYPSELLAVFAEQSAAEACADNHNQDHLSTAVVDSVPFNPATA